MSQNSGRSVMTANKGAAALAALYTDDNGSENDFIAAVAAEFTELLNEWHSRPQLLDPELDAYVHSIYAELPQLPKLSKPKHFFSPSSTDACTRSLYEQQRGADRDVQREQPHKKRWTQIGTAIGDMVQKDLLLIEKHMPEARFRFARNAAGYPMFEEFASTCKLVQLDGTQFAVCGSPDGIMIYTDENGKEHRIGLEVKSKQTTPARTSRTSMKEADVKHIAQVRTYAHLYDVDHYLIIYVNAAHKSWNMTDEDFEKTPDIRVFGIDCSEEKRLISLRKMAKAQQAVDNEQPPLPDLAKWTFNNFKTAIARSVTDDELAQLEQQLLEIEAGSLKDWIKREYRQSFEQLRSMAFTEREKAAK